MTLDFFHDSCCKFEDFLRRSKPSIDSFHPFFGDAFWEIMLNGGKRFRPKLLLSLVCSNSPELLLNSFDVALAIEVMHSYSLIHDDLPFVDNAMMRRGHEAIHVKYGSCGAMLVGDALNTYSFLLLSRCKLNDSTKIRLIEELSFNSGIHGMVLGQAIDCHFEKGRLSLDELEFMHTNKTARLIAASLKMGGLVSGLRDEFLCLLYDFGIHLGIFFQIRDDIIDFLQSRSEAGKDTGSDAMKNSYVNLLGINGAKQKFVEFRNLLVAELADLGVTIGPRFKLFLEDLLGGYFEEVG